MELKSKGKLETVPGKFSPEGEGPGVFIHLSLTARQRELLQLWKTPLGLRCQTGRWCWLKQRKCGRSESYGGGSIASAIFCYQFFWWTHLPPPSHLPTQPPDTAGSSIGATYIIYKSCISLFIDLSSLSIISDVILFVPPPPHQFGKNTFNLHS